MARASFGAPVPIQGPVAPARSILRRSRSSTPTGNGRGPARAQAGVHFGHQTRRWNPKMRRYIFGERDGIHIIDLQQTEKLLATAQEFAAGVAARGGTVLFVGTKKQARDTIQSAAEAAGMPYI